MLIRLLLALVLFSSFTAFAKGPKSGGGRSGDAAHQAVVAEEDKVESACGCRVRIGTRNMDMTDNALVLKGAKSISAALVRLCTAENKKDLVCDQVEDGSMRPASAPTVTFANKFIICRTTASAACSSADIVTAVKSFGDAQVADDDTPPIEAGAIGNAPPGECVRRHKTHIPTGFFTTSGDGADMNGDGKVDLIGMDGASTNEKRSGFRVYLSKGGGKFDKSIFSYAPIGLTAASVAFGDVNGDKIPDAFVVDSTNQTMAVFAGRRDGKFEQKGTVVGKEGATPRIVDITGDGKPDLVWEDSLSNQEGLKLNVNTGGGKFAPAKLVGADDASSATYDGVPWFFTEMTGDALPDIVSSRVRGDPPYGPCIARNLGGNRFANKVTCFDSGLYGEGNGGSMIQTNGSLLVADFNGDKKPDVIVGPQAGSYVNEKELAVMLNEGKGKLGKAKLMALHRSSGKSFDSLLLADVSGDGKPDVVGILRGSHGFAVNLVLSKGDGTFSAPMSTNPLPVSGEVTFRFIDVEGSGTPDLVAFSFESIDVFEIRCSP